jgi:hypothetical protein
MRSLLPAALLLLLAAGCLNGPTRVSGFDGPTCPNWTVAPHPLYGVSDVQFYATSNDNSKPHVNNFPDHASDDVYTDDSGRKADQLRITFPSAGSQAPYAVRVDNGTLVLRAFRNDTGEQLDIYPADNPGDRRAEWAFPAGKTLHLELQTDLTPATREPSPAQVRLEWGFTGLGPNNDGSKPGPLVGAYFSFEGSFLYRAAGCLQK